VPCACGVRRRVVGPSFLHYGWLCFVGEKERGRRKEARDNGGENGKFEFERVPWHNFAHHKLGLRRELRHFLV
jgi:hypothetical protein